MGQEPHRNKRSGASVLSLAPDRRKNGGIGLREIPLTQGKVAIVDDDDYERLAKYKWCTYRSETGTWYVVRGEMSTRGYRHVRMHRAVLNAKPGEHCDHINGNGLDNRKSNLRIATNQQNSWNRRKPINGIARYKGVRAKQSNGKWTAQITIGGHHRYIGTFPTQEEAARAYDKAAMAVFGEYAKLNFPHSKGAI
jgi:hypothetical protein